MSLRNSLEYMELNLRCSFSLTLRQYRLNKALSQSELASLLVNPQVTGAESYSKELECWKKKISNWENGYSLPTLSTFFYLVSLFGIGLADGATKNNKFLEDVQFGDAAFQAET